MSLSLFMIDFGYGNKLVRLRQGDEIKARFQGHSVILQIYFATMLSLFFMLASLIVHSVVFLPMTIELSTISYKNNNKHYHITHNDRTFLN